MTVNIIIQVVLIIIMLGALFQSVIFLVQKKKGWWLGLTIASLMVVATILNWLK